MTMMEAMSEGLTLMYDVLGGRRKPDEKLVRAYLFVIQDDGFHPEDIEAACKWFCRSSEGTFPPGPIFRKRCQVEASHRERRRQNAIYESNLALMDDPYADESDTVTREEAQAIIQAALARLEGKFRHNILTERPKTARQIQSDIKAMRGAE